MPLTVTVDAETYEVLGHICNGNRSAAIETLVRDYLATRQRAQAASTPAP